MANDQIASIIQAAEMCYVLQDSIFCTISPVTHRLTTTSSLRNNNNFVYVGDGYNLLISTYSGLQWSDSLILLNHSVAWLLLREWNGRVVNLTTHLQHLFPKYFNVSLGVNPKDLCTKRIQLLFHISILLIC